MPLQVMEETDKFRASNEARKLATALDDLISEYMKENMRDTYCLTRYQNVLLGNFSLISRFAIESMRNSDVVTQAEIEHDRGIILDGLYKLIEDVKNY